MLPLDEMRHLVDHGVFETFYRLLCEFQIDPYATGFSIAAAPLSLHSLDPPVSNLNV